MASNSEPLERSPRARRIAENALVGLMVALQDPDLPLVVLGGLVPEVLTSGQEPPAPQHLGTVDVDIHLDLGVDTEADLSALEGALHAAGFDTDSEGWRWHGRIDAPVVSIEFLCELHDQREGALARPPGCKKLRAVNLRGTGFVAEDFEWVEVSGDLADGEHTVRVRFAGLEGYLLSKAYAAWTRGEERDYYDFVYTLLYNRLGGPAEAAAALANGKFRDRLNPSAGPWPELRARFSGPQDIGPRSYAAQALQAVPTGDLAVFREDAVGTVAAFLQHLARPG